MFFRKMQNLENVSIPTLEELQQRFHAVPRFRDPNRREYMWFQADDVARVFGYSECTETLMYTVHHEDRVWPGKLMHYGFNSVQIKQYDINSLEPECSAFLTQSKKVINQFGVVQLAQRSRLPFCIRFKYWLYSTYSLTELNSEPILRDLEIIEDGSCVIEARKAPKLKHTVKVNKTEESESSTTEHVFHDIEYERELTKRLELEKNFQLEMCKLDLRRLEIDREYHDKYLKKNA